MKWNDINTSFPELIPYPEGSDCCGEFHTNEVLAKTVSHGEVITYHDGDVWCYPHLSGCPQYEVVHWKELPEDCADNIYYDGLHCRVKA